MKCACPKCSAPLHENLPEIPEKGKNGKCSNCSSSYWIHRESFILRGYAVTGERSCSKCGEALGQSTYCPGCGTLYPEYCIVYSKKPAKRAFEKKSFSLNLSFPKVARNATAKSSRLVSIDEGSKTVSSDLRRQLLMVGAGIAVLAVIAVLVILYKQDRAATKFTRDFVVVLYGLKSGTDQCLKKSEILGNGSRLVDKDIMKLKSVNAEIATALQVLSPPPTKFNDVYARLGTLSGTYEKLYTLCITSGPSTEAAASARDLELQFIKQAKELKGALPPELLAELADKTSRYSNLQFMLE